MCMVSTHSANMCLLCAQPCTEQSPGPKSDMVSVVTKFLIWKGDKYRPLGHRLTGALIGTAKGSVKAKAQRKNTRDSSTEESDV